MSNSNSNDPISGANSLLTGDAESDTPCIGICSTLYDEICKGCGRTFEEVQRWPEMSPGSKRAVWRRITLHGDSWRFNRYAERAKEDAKPT